MIAAAQAEGGDSEAGIESFQAKAREHMRKARGES
jgi:hypothetical protein